MIDSLFKTLVMADGTPLYNYLKDAAPKDMSDQWTAGYEECKRRLFKIIATQLEPCYCDEERYHPRRIGDPKRK